MFLIGLNIAIVTFDIYMWINTGYWLWLPALAIALLSTYFAHRSWKIRRELDR